jgi:hypothetical protein
LPLPIATAAIITAIATATATAITTAKARQRDRRNMVTVPGASGFLCFFCVVWERAAERTTPLPITIVVVAERGGGQSGRQRRRYAHHCFLSCNVDDVVAIIVIM